MIEKEKIEHIADLAKLYIKEEEYPKYQQQCTDILSEIEKIVSVEVSTDEIMISPVTEINKFTDDIVEDHISKTDAFKNSKRVKGDYITVPKVVGGEE
ncbi:MAG: Asp-tRNA(Asn)/Glu-tRNA(Gln) amidotransferase subunit GatC [Bacilli bacterium]|nr:Asp-tRNA(Asn)/Glu-tRNA(Gln) amidotransferase subunit GatC [Bacilli bacterium]